jgi:hypothetical protein
MPAPVQGVVAFVSCSPAREKTQLPSLPGTAQDWQLPVHAVAQQTPSMQKPLPQSVAPFGHNPPLGFLFVEQVPEPLQYCIGPSQGAVALWSCAPTLITVHDPSDPALPHV